MGDSDSAEQTFHPAESRMRGIRRVWKWGIGFWIVAWIYSALVVKLGISFNFPGFGMILAVSSGSFYAGIVDALPSGGIEWIPPEFVFSEGHLARFRDFPEDILGMLGRVELRHRASDYYFAFPMAGVLWLWLLLGWTDGYKNFQWLKSVKSPRMLARITILVCLPLLISFSEYAGRKRVEASTCSMSMRNIQQAVRGYQGVNNLPSGPLDWSEIFGPGKFFPAEYAKCPSGLPYRLSKNMPAMGELAAECQNPEHLERIKADDQTKTW
jgi:hypothetical protein